MPKRICGSCSLCCKIMAVPDFPAKPGDHDWCRHANKGCGGCAIYPQRPGNCRDFACMWLTDERFGEHWYPAKAKIVVQATIENGTKYVNFVVDPAYPLRWREDPWLSGIKEIARAGIEGRLGEKWTTLVQVGDDRIPILR